MGAVVALGGNANAGSNQCPVGEFCIWEHSSYQGRFAYSSEPQPNVGAYMNDRMTSYWNRTNTWISTYNHENFGDCMLVIPPGGASPAVPSQFNDDLTSFKPGQC
ncbi:peptidase inhibitor family I36 protein [Streptomyces sp. NPDC085946]|uniref:peptidase inhibitor family I36 protein n=1 Tax=Streptomyces sp. NPDC085946 TaxID=3365744 RepID=UPI0037CCFA9B